MYLGRRSLAVAPLGLCAPHSLRWAPTPHTSRTNLQQGQPHREFSGDFAVPESAEDPERRLSFDFDSCGRPLKIDDGRCSCPHGEARTGRPGGIFIDALVRTRAALFMSVL